MNIRRAKMRRYATCIKCAYAITWFANEHLRFAMNCPACGAEKQFGPGVFVSDFHGYTMKEVMRQQSEKRKPC